jgi:hypothetical protein
MMVIVSLLFKVIGCMAKSPFNLAEHVFAAYHQAKRSSTFDINQIAPTGCDSIAKPCGIPIPLT